MTPQEEKLIREWNDEISRDIQISLLITDDKRTKEFREFCESLERLAPKSRIIKEKGQPKEPPAIQIGSTLRYHAVPLGAELKPFLQTLSLSPDKLAAIPASLHEHLKKLKLPTTLKLFIAQQCPVCPTVVPQITGLAKANELISVTVIDCTLFPEMAQSDRVQSVPTVVLGEHFRWTGLVQLEELVEVIINRDPAALPVSSLERMLEEGSALQVAEMMLDKQQIFPVFFDLLTHDKWGIRLGAMTVMEVIAERDPQLAAQVINPLWARFDAVEAPVKGDILYILGNSGDQRMVPRLEMILSGLYDPEVKEAAREALETIFQTTNRNPA